MPDLMRIRGDILVRMADDRAAEELFLRAIELAEMQSALSWRLRAGVSLARLRLRQGRPAEAEELVAECYSRFSEGFETVDLQAARSLLQDSKI
jgi:predicted ATPase